MRAAAKEFGLCFIPSRGSSQMTNAEISLIWTFGDVLIGNPAKYLQTFKEVKKHFFDRPRSKEFKDILDCAEKIFEKHQPKNRAAVKRMIKQLLNSRNRTVSKVRFLLNISLAGIEADEEMRKAPYYDPIKGFYIDRE